MTENVSLGSQIVARELEIQRLLDQASLVGGIYTMGYDECLVITNDLWKRQADGIPQHSFLLATTMMPGEAPDIRDEEIILLRVVGPAALPEEGDLVRVREQAMREMVITHGADGAASSPMILDVLTRNEIQFSALKAKVLGTFYETDINGTPLLSFGGDVESFYSSSRYKVYKPFGESLSIIASYPESTELEERIRQQTGTSPRRVRIGSIRYSSTNRRNRLRQGDRVNTDIPIRVNVQDFVAMKTAVFGMTRLGKSNTMKTIATSVYQHACETGRPIGQLLFDPAGEYANVNVQDQTALAQIGPEFVTIFRYGVDRNQPGIRPLSSNFFSDETLDLTWQIITLQLSGSGSNYIQSFVSADVIGPDNEADDRAAYNRARRRRAALYATLLKAGFRPPQNLNVRLVVNRDVLNAVNNKLSEDQQPFQAGPRGLLQLNSNNLISFWDALIAADRDGADLGDWIDPGLEAILAFYRGSVGSGYRLLEPLRVFHAPNYNQDYAADILQELIAGKIVIVDLSLGTESILQFCSERIISYIVQNAATRFAAGEEPHQIQIFLEEAHRLFNRDQMNKKQDSDPYVRLAKEAAKFNIGLIYATQEISGVDPVILSNTSNWIVTHLNNRTEVKEFSKYYDFQDFGELTLRAEDVGFARMKTRSGRYIVPMQIDLFDASRVQAARRAALATQTQQPQE